MKSVKGEDTIVEFESLFRKSAGKPIQYHGETLMLMDKIPVPDKFKLSVILHPFRMAASNQIQDKRQDDLP